MESTSQKPIWSLSKKIWFLFIVVYFFFLITDFTSSDELFPHFVFVLMKPYTNFMNWLVVWSGKNVLHLSYPITVMPNGSGDTTYNYVMQLLWVVLALLIALIGAWTDRRRPSYNQLRYWARIVLRYYLAFILFVYGFDKVIKLQFPAPDAYRLTETYGDSSPMGLAWTFFGYSKGYNIFTGGAEVLAGCFLFFKRTTLLGAVLATIVMANIVAVNFAFDVPVKIYSTNLLILAGWIAWYDIDRLINVFLLNKPAPAAQLRMPQQTKWKKIIQSSLKVLAIAFALYSTLWTAMQNEKKYGEAAPKPILYGAYNTELFVKKKDTLPPLTTDDVRWKRLLINFQGFARITTMNESDKRMKLRIDTVRKTMLFSLISDSTITYNFSYQQPDKDHLWLRGLVENDSAMIKMKKIDLNSFRLVSRGFNWINEYPYNR